MVRKLDPAVTSSLAEAVRRVEDCSCAELVVEVRARSGSYAQADARFAALFAFIVLLVTLFSAWSFGPVLVAVDVALAYGIGLVLAARSDLVRRLMTTSRERAERVRIHAAAAFVERGIANTSLESGVLLYLSLMERQIDIIADRGVLNAVPSLEWNQLLVKAKRSEASLDTLLEVVRLLEPLLGSHLPASSGDRDELPNAPRFQLE